MLDFIEKYCKEYGTRFTKSQKNKFIDEVVKDYKDLGYWTRVHECKQGIKRVKNILIGNVDTAKTIIVAPYDTPSKALFSKYKYYPLDRTKTVKQEKVNNYFQVIICLLICSIAKYLLSLSDSFESNIKLLITLFVVLLIGVSVKIYIGFSARLCYNRNSVSIALIRDIASKMNPEKAAIILLDYSISSFEGYKQVCDYYGNMISTKRFILLNCLGENDSIVIGCRHNSLKFAKELLADEKSDISIEIKVLEDDVADKLPLFYFPNCLILTSGQYYNDDLVVYNTRSGKDSKVNISNVMKLADMLLKKIC